MDKTIKVAIGLFMGVALACAIFFVMPHPAEKTPILGTGDSASGNVTVYFFYGEECPHCHAIMPLIESLKTKYPTVNSQILEIWHNPTNQALSDSLNKKLGVNGVGVPEVILGNVVLVGDKDIPAKLEAAIIVELGKRT